VRQELYPRGCGSLDLIGCGYRRCHVEIGSGIHIDIPRHAHRKRAFGNAQAIIRCGEPVQIQWWVRIFARRGAEEPIVAEGRGHLTDWAMMKECR
jgi:hypothetical protein